MGNYKFRYSDMMPNAWFYKLRDMRIRTRNHNTSHAVNKKLPPPPTTTTTTAPPQKPHLSPPRPSSSRHHTRPPTTTTTADKLYNSPTNPKAFDTHFPDPPPRKSSSKRRTKRKTTLPNPSPRLLLTSSVSADCSCRATLNSVWSKLEPIPQAPDQKDFVFFFSNASDENISPDAMNAYGTDSFKFNELPSSSSWSSGRCSCCRLTSSTSDIIRDPMNETSYFSTKVEKLEGFVDTFAELELPPILTKPVKFKETNSKTTKRPKSSTKSEDQRKAHSSLSTKIIEENSASKAKKETKTITTNSLIRKSVVSYSPGVKLRAINSPKTLSRKKKVLQACGRRRRTVSTSGESSKLRRRKSFWESFVIVKSSFDPQRDFEESMMEMIVENKIRASKDFEDLLACYLLLNSNEYHETIVKAFQQIWFDMIDLRM